MSEKVLRYTIPQSSSSGGSACVTIDVLADTGFLCMDAVEIFNTSGGSSSSSSSGPGAPMELKPGGWSDPPLPGSDTTIDPGDSWASGNGEWPVDGSTQITVCGDPGDVVVVRYTGSASSCP